jgi:hypothetical protein
MRGNFLAKPTGERIGLAETASAYPAQANSETTAIKTQTFRTMRASSKKCLFSRAAQMCGTEGIGWTLESARLRDKLKSPALERISRRDLFFSVYKKLF